MGKWNSQLFTAPGTWTWPGNVSNVIVFLVGGGGGGSQNGIPLTTNQMSGGGGGGVRRLFVPVTAPVSVLVGSAGFNNSSGGGGAGGTSQFGPLYQVGGGGGGCDYVFNVPGTNAPPIGGGGGGGYNLWAGNSNITLGCSNAGAYGYPALARSGGGAGGTAVMGLGSGMVGTLLGARGRYGFGGGGVVSDDALSPDNIAVAASDGGRRNSGAPGELNSGAPNSGGGGVGLTRPSQPGRVEVYWFE